jgi:signal peptidase
MSELALPATASPAAPRASRGPLRIALTSIAGIVTGVAAGAILVAILATWFFDYRALTVSSGSMAPALAQGDLIIVRPVKPQDLAAGDIVLFEAGGDRVPTVHRITGINEIETRITDRATGTVTTHVERRFVTQGDANPAPDRDELTVDRLRGEVWFTIPNAGALGSAGLLLVFIGVFVAVVVLWIAFEAWLRVRQRHQEVR